MKIAVLIARILLGLDFFVFGLNGFVQFLHMPLPTGVAGQFVGALVASHFMLFVSGIQVVAGLLLLVNRYVPLALVLLGPLMVSILLFHSLMQPSGLPPAIVAALLWFLIFWKHRASFAGIFAQKA